MNWDALPWYFAVATMVAFGFLAHKANRNWALWALGGGFLGLVISTFVLGLCHAVFLRESYQAYVAFRARQLLYATILILFFGWIVTEGLHHQALRMKEGFKELFSAGNQQKAA